jgi:hypothetical protein
MSVAIVNGYVCMSSCDAAKARKGDDPREAKNLAAGADERLRAGRNETAVKFGGALLDPRNAIRAADQVGASDHAISQQLSRAVDLSA